VIGAALVIAVLAVYAQCISHPFLRLDDPDYVLENEHVSSGLSAANVAWAMTAIHASNWHPLTWISHMADVELFGLHAGKHILVSVALHALNSLLLFLVLRRATRSLWKSAAVAALFALHPLHVESVAWVSERKDVLSTLFFLITLYLWIGWVENRARARYWGAVAAFALGLMAKPMLVTTPFVLLLLDWWPFRRKIDRQTVIEKWPFFALTFASILITLRAQRVAMGSSPLELRIGNALLSYAGYLRKTFWPSDLAIVYPFPDRLSASAVVFAAILLMAITAGAFFYRRRAPFLLTGWLWYLGTLVPVIGIVQVGHEAMADRYTYIPLIGIFIAIAWSSERVIRSRVALASAAAIAVAALAACTYHQLRYWRDGVVLFEHALRVNDNRHAREGLARELLHDGDHARAAAEFRNALQAAPRDDGMRVGLGMALMQLADPAGARREFEAAASINPRNAVALRRLGDLALADGRIEDAKSLLRRSAAINRDPSTLAVLAVARGNVDEAVSLYRQAIAKHPEKAEIRNDLAAVLSKSGREREALAEYEAALKIDPHQYEAQMNLGAALTRLDRNDEAVVWFERAGKERPESAEPHIYLALMYARAKRNEDAIREATAALRINPASANLQFTNALRLPFNESNLAGWIDYLQKRPPGEPGGRR
jgi:protein O-mannosyl-transferase